MAILIHTFWAQGWRHAPGKALRTSEAWEEYGEVYRWDTESAAKNQLLPPGIARDCSPALLCDVVLAAAQLRFGGLAADADMGPADFDGYAREIRLMEECPRPVGIVAYATWGDQPYNAGSWFPPSNPWLAHVVGHHRLLNLSGRKEQISQLTGPKLWRHYISSASNTFVYNVRTYPAYRMFTHENEVVRDDNKGAWIDPGFISDWHGEHPEQWK